MKAKINLLDLSIEEIQDLAERLGQQKFRGKQIFSWIHKGISEFDEMTDISKNLRDELAKIAYIGKLKVAEKLISKEDSTRKYLFVLEDENIIESVLMEYEHGFSVCISTQVGCKMGCSFCASTGMDFVRNLTPGEMLDQILQIQNDLGKRIGNFVLMGIGEPLDNYENTLKFLKTVNSKNGLNIGYRHISISTCGLVDKIKIFAKEKIPVTLSVSLHAPNDEIRSALMPVNISNSIDKVIKECQNYTEITKRRITFEYALIKDVNDSTENACELAERIKGMLVHVNLIPVNIIKKTDYKRSEKSKIEKFKKVLLDYGIETTVRRELGSDIEAACGQLRKSRLNKSQT